MEAESARGYRDDSPRLPRLSLGLSSVRSIVNKLESEYTRVIATAALNTSRELVKYDPNIDEGYHDYDDSSLDRSRERVWRRFVVNLAVALSRCIPSVTFGNFGVLAVATGLFAPKMISYLVVYPFCRLVFGTLYPAYASYKAVRTKNLKEYVKWMMYWIVFALFTCTETFTDMFLSWFPFYYEVKIVLVLWLLSPATKGSSILYRKFVHPALCRREQEIDEYIAKAKDQGYHTVLNLGTKGVNYATTVIMQTAIKGGGGLVQQLRKSYSLSDLTECEPREERGSDEADDVLAEPRVIRRVVKSSGYNTRRSASESNSRSPMYFPEVDVDVRPARSRTDEPDFSHIKSTEDISSGYSSADNSASLTRTGSLGARARARAAKTTVTTIKRPQAAEESEVIIEEVTDDDTFEYANMPPLVALPSPLFMSATDPPFLYQYVGDQVKIIQVLGNYPLTPTSNLQTNNTDHRDQNEISSNEVSLNKDATDVDTKTDNSEYEPNYNNSEKDLISDIPDKDVVESVTTEDKSENVPIETTLPERDIPVDKTVEENVDNGSTECNNPFTEKKYNDAIETASLDTSTYNNDNDSTESDDEASFGTPDNSPRSKRKTSKGKYGKAKAPAPPPPQRDVANDQLVKTSDNTESKPTEESLFLDIMKIVPHTSLPGRVKNAQIINPIAENKRRHKSKSPCRTPKSSSSGIGKLLHLPSKLAFWHKTEESTTKTDSISISSDDRSRRSSTVEMAFDDFQSCTDLNVLVSKNVPNVVTEDIRDESNTNENISQNILNKSDTLQKLIDAKLESHPEYKTVSLHEEIPTTSKSTDV